MGTTLTMALAIWESGRISSAAPSSAAALGMPQTTLDASSWAIVHQFNSRSLSSPMHHHVPYRSSRRQPRASANSVRDCPRTRQPTDDN